MTPPTLLSVIGRLLAFTFHQEPPTFTSLDSARRFRWRLSDKTHPFFTVPDQGDTAIQVSVFLPLGRYMNVTDLGWLEKILLPTSDRCLAQKGFPFRVWSALAFRGIASARRTRLRHSRLHRMFAGQEETFPKVETRFV
jgi:hypothetical protein